MSDDKATKPTIETVLERIGTLEERLDAKLDSKLGALEERLNDKIDGVEGRLNVKIDGLEGRFNAQIDRIDIRLERFEAVLNAARGDMLDQRIEMRELRKQLQEHFPAVS
jgi:hypothetical protein